MRYKTIPGQTNTISQLLWARLTLLMGSMLMLFLASACTIEDPEYAQKITGAKTSCTGNEIVGIWVSKIHHRPLDLDSGRITLLLRPDGTGRSAEKVTGFDNHRSEADITWHYSGSGVWDCTSRFVSGPSIGQNGFFKIHYCKNELLGDFGPAHLLVVFVNSENEAAVDEYLQKH